MPDRVRRIRLIKRPSTVVTLAFNTIQATPNSGTLPSIKESTNIIISRLLCSAGLLPSLGGRDALTTPIGTAALL
jgi:hypothetical protein